MKPKQPWIFWIILGGAVAVGLYYFDAAVRERAGAEHAQRQRYTSLEIDRMCGEWKTDEGKFSDCGQAYRYWRACEKVWLETRQRLDIGEAGDVVCEHPVYLFHAQQQARAEAALHSLDVKP
jgi:hypothetical protein